MKRIISIILIAVMLLALSATTSFAETNYLYENRFFEQYVEGSGYEDYYNYAECYYHHIDENDPDSEIDWVLVHCNINLEEMIYTAVIGNRVYVGSHGYPFGVNYAVYDVKLDCFIGVDTYQVLEKYEDLEDVINNKVRFGELLGDTDSDECLSILDATTLQRGLVNGEYTYEYSMEYNVADFDLDYNVTVMDATAIQMHLAGIKSE